MILICLISFLLDGVFSLVVNDNSLFLSLFSLMCLIVIYPYMKCNNHIFYYSIVIGLFFDIAYTQTLFLNTVIFFLMAILIYYYFKYLPYNIINIILLSLVTIILFRLVTYVFFVIFEDNIFNMRLLFRSIYTSIISNIVYVLFMNYLCKIILKKNASINKVK